ncbi:MAG: hypothetical protein ACR2N2_05465 [Acidimicrobiia bacterium]
MTSRILPVLVGLALFCACTSADESSAPTTNGADGTPPSEAAVEANEAMQALPDGYADCGTVSLSSGWPTTTAYFAEVRGQCIAEAVITGNPSQQAFSGRDNEGGIVGTIVRVNGPGDIVVVDYRIDVTGTVASSESRCAKLDSTGVGPPTCTGS